LSISIYWHPRKVLPPLLDWFKASCITFLPLGYNLGFVSRTRTCDRGLKSRMLVPSVFPKVTLVSPQRLIPHFIHFGLSRTSRAHSVWF